MDESGDDISCQQAFSGALRRVRRLTRLSVEELAVRAKMNAERILAIERGGQDPSFTEIHYLAHGLGMRAHWLVEAAELYGLRVMVEMKRLRQERERAKEKKPDGAPEGSAADQREGGVGTGGRTA